LDPQPFGKYLLVERIGSGGMAEVFRARTQGVGGFEKELAIKRIHPHHATDSEFVNMFVDEAKIASALSHANIAQIFDLGCIDDAYFIAMEYVHGANLAAVLRDALLRAQPLSILLAIHIAREVASGLYAAHTACDPAGHPLGVVHRDISPQNIQISYSGEVKIIDFGVAKARSKLVRTSAGTIRGKLTYMAPEQVRAQPVDGRADIFSLGLVLYKMLVGRNPFDSQGELELVSKLRRCQIDPPRSLNDKIPRELERIVMRALARRPADRYPDCHQLQQELSQLLWSLDPRFSGHQLADYMQALYARELAPASPAGQPWQLPAQVQPLHASSILPLLATPPRSPREPAAPREDDLSATIPDPAHKHPPWAEASARLDLEPPRPAPERPLARPSPVPPPVAPLPVPPPVVQVARRPSPSPAPRPELYGMATELVSAEERQPSIPAELAATTVGLPSDEVPFLSPSDPAQPRRRHARWLLLLFLGLAGLGLVGWLLLGDRPPRPGNTTKSSIKSGTTSPVAEPPPQPLPGGADRTRPSGRPRSPTAAGAPASPVQTGAIHLQSRPPGAEVHLDGVRLTETRAHGARRARLTPTLLEGLAGGSHDLRLVLPGYGRWERTVSTRPGETLRIVAQIQEDQGRLRVTTTPAGARVWVAGEELGKTPVELTNLPTGVPLKVELALRGHQRHAQEVTLGDNLYQLLVTLEPD